MHPKMMIALANEAERERQNERQKLYLRSQVPADPGQGAYALGARTGLVRRLAGGISLRPGLS